MTFTQSIATCFTKYATFSGRATRPEYWYWVLFTAPLSILLLVFSDALNLIFSLVTFLPGLAVSARRLHDIGKSAWWLLVALIPILGGFVLLYWTVQPGEGANEYGPDPSAPVGGSGYTAAGPVR